jgi:hypothetical protein
MSDLNESLPSQFQIGDEVPIKAKIVGVLFTKGKVNYVVEDSCGGQHRIDSCAIHYLVDDEASAPENAA